MSKPVATFIFDRGETISIALEISTGDPSLVTAVAANLRFVPWGKTAPPEGQPVAAVFVTAPYVAAGAVPAGWTLTIDAATCAGLAPGTYHTDAIASVAGGVIITDRLAILINQSVSG